MDDETESFENKRRTFGRPPEGFFGAGAFEEAIRRISCRQRRRRRVQRRRDGRDGQNRRRGVARREEDPDRNPHSPK